MSRLGGRLRDARRAARASAVGAAGWALSGCVVPDSVAYGYYGVLDDGGDEAAPANIAANTTPDAIAPPSLPVEAGTQRDARGSVDAGVGPTSTVGCDLSGRWLVVVREVTTGLGAEEADHEWLYFEMAQTGSALTVTKGLSCGQNVVGISAVSANVDDPKVWPAMLTYDVETGRAGTSVAMGSECAVSFDKFYEIVGATVSYYQNPSTTMPTPSQEATSGSPGWEDWDNDGKPGFTVNVTGLATGQIYLSSRRWNQWSGTIPTGSNTFTIPDDWNIESDLLGYNGSSLLTETADATKDNDASLHFVSFARLSPSQATGDDSATCAAVRSLAPTLAPQASN